MTPSCAARCWRPIVAAASTHGLWMQQLHAGLSDMESKKSLGRHTHRGKNLSLNSTTDPAWCSCLEKQNNIENLNIQILFWMQRMKPRLTRSTKQPFSRCSRRKKTKNQNSGGPAMNRSTRKIMMGRAFQHTLAFWRWSSPDCCNWTGEGGSQ